LARLMALALRYDGLPHRPGRELRRPGPPRACEPGPQQPDHEPPPVGASHPGTAAVLDARGARPRPAASAPPATDRRSALLARVTATLAATDGAVSQRRAPATSTKTSTTYQLVPDSQES